MKNFVTFNQKNFLEIGKLKNIKVDATDAILFDWIQNFTNSKKALKKLINNDLYFWCSYQKMADDNPICNISCKRVMERRITKLIDLGLLKKYTSKEDGNKVFLHITDFAYKHLQLGEEITPKSLQECKVLSTDEYEALVPTSTKPLDSGVRSLSTDEYDNSELYIGSYDRKLNIEEEKEKKEFSLAEHEIFKTLSKEEKELYLEYLALRKKLKLQTTELIHNRLLNKLKNFGNVKEVILNAITSNWKDFYPINTKAKEKAEYIKRCTKEKEIDYSQPVDPRRPF